MLSRDGQGCFPHLSNFNMYTATYFRFPRVLYRYPSGSFIVTRKAVSEITSSD